MSGGQLLMPLHECTFVQKRNFKFYSRNSSQMMSTVQKYKKLRDRRDASFTPPPCKPSMTALTARQRFGTSLAIALLLLHTALAARDWELVDKRKDNSSQTRTDSSLSDPDSDTPGSLVLEQPHPPWPVSTVQVALCAGSDTYMDGMAV